MGNALRQLPPDSELGELLSAVHPSAADPSQGEQRRLAAVAVLKRRLDRGWDPRAVWWTRVRNGDDRHH